MSQVLSFSSFISDGFPPKTIAEACLKNPINTIAVSRIAIIVMTGCTVIPAEKVSNLVRNIPKGGAPVIAKKPIKNNILVIGNALSAPLTLAIFAE